MSLSNHSCHKKKDYRGKFRGTVFDNIDPLLQGRLLVVVPDVLGDDPCIWARSASPMTAMGMGLFWVPPVESGVWIEFEGGDPNQPVWTGCWRGAAEDKPVLANVATPGNPPIVLGTLAQNSIALCDGPLPPGIVTTGIAIQSGASMIVISPDGITITAPKIQINGLTIINAGAMTITV